MHRRRGGTFPHLFQTLTCSYQDFTSDPSGSIKPLSKPRYLEEHFSTKPRWFQPRRFPSWLQVNYIHLSSPEETSPWLDGRSGTQKDFETVLSLAASGPGLHGAGCCWLKLCHNNKNYFSIHVLSVSQWFKVLDESQSQLEGLDTAKEQHPQVVVFGF